MQQDCREPPAAPFQAVPPSRSRRNQASRHGAVPWWPLGLLLIAPGGALLQRSLPEHALDTGAALLAASGLTYLLYAEDKRRAQLGIWRIPEMVLHLGALGGGWPGAFAAQRRLRHKTAKPRFLLVFWLVVAGYEVVALDCLLGWPGRDKLIATLQAA